MMLTWTPNPVPYEQAFEAIKAAIDAMPAGVKLFINSGTFAVQLLAKFAVHLVFRRVLRPRFHGGKLRPPRCIL